MLAGLYAAAGVQLREGGVHEVPRPPHHVAVVGGQGRVVQTPVQQVIVLQQR